MATAYPSIGPTPGGEEREDANGGNVVVCKVVNKIYRLRKGCKNGAFKQLEYREIQREVCMCETE